MDRYCDQYGHDDNIFISDVPEYLHCVVCSLVLRDPIMILKCGHKFCEVCFERIKQHGLRSNADILCPIDRDVVELADVRADVGMRRIVGNLSVKCLEHENGCTWCGDLRDLNDHHSGCGHRQVDVGVIGGDRLRNLSDRLDQHEIALADKDREIASLKIIVQEQQEMQQEQQQQLQEQLQHQQQQQKQLNEQLLQIKQQFLNQQRCMQQQKQLQNDMELLKEKNKKLELQLERITEGDKDEEQTQIVQLKGRKDAVIEDGEIAVAVDSSEKIPEDTCAHVPTLADTRSVRRKKIQRKHYSKTKIENHPVPRKNAILQHYSGDPASISRNGCSVTFNLGTRSTVSSPMAIVRCGKKAWYEVKCSFPNVSSLAGSACGIGWWAQTLSDSGAVGDGTGVYNYDPSNGKKRHNSDRSYWGGDIRCWAGETCFVGVALDMMNGEISFSYDGSWEPPLGVAFSRINTNHEFFPALSTYGLPVTFEVNFGDRDFTYGPPDRSFEKLLDVV